MLVAHRLVDHTTIKSSNPIYGLVWSIVKREWPDEFKIFQRQVVYVVSGKQRITQL